MTNRWYLCNDDSNATARHLTADPIEQKHQQDQHHGQQLLPQAGGTCRKHVTLCLVYRGCSTKTSEKVLMQ